MNFVSNVTVNRTPNARHAWMCHALEPKKRPCTRSTSTSPVSFCFRLFHFSFHSLLVFSPHLSSPVPFVFSLAFQSLIHLFASHLRQLFSLPVISSSLTSKHRQLSLSSFVSKQQPIHSPTYLAEVMLITQKGLQERVQAIRPIYKNSSSASTAAVPTTPPSNLEIIQIEIRLDSDGKDIVLWDDILSAFKDAVNIRRGVKVLPFLKDKEFRKYAVLCSASCAVCFCFETRFLWL